MEEKTVIKTDDSQELNKWYVFPDDLQGGQFLGYENRKDASQLRGAWVLGQNVKFGGASLPSLRQGYELVGVEDTGSVPVSRAWVFETRAGTQFELKIIGDTLYFELVGTSTEFVSLLTGLTAGTEWTFNNIGKTANATTHCIFSNGVDGGYKFSGAYATLDSTGYTAGAIREKAINAAGTGYVVDEIITVTGGGGNATYKVTSVGGVGDVTGLECTNPGTGYAIAAGVATTASAAGVGLTVDISNVGQGFIKKTGTTTFAEEGFDAPGYININGTNYSYSNSDGVFLIAIGADPTGEVAGSLMVQTPVEVSAITAVQGSVGMAHDGRLHLRLETKQDVWNYSKLDDPFDFTAAPAGDGIGGSKEVEFGGPIVSFAKLNKAILCFKKRIIKMLTFEANSTRVDVPVYKTITPADDKGTTLGAVGQKSTVSTPYGVVFLTPDHRLVLLTGITDNNEPKFLVLSDPIQPVFDDGVFDSASIICSDNILLLSFKQDKNSTFNDTVLRGDMTRRSIDSNGETLPIRWDTPYVGWNVNDWTAVEDQTTGKNVVHWHSSINGSTYAITDAKMDSTTGFGGTIRTWSETFGFPQYQKRISNAFVEIRLRENTEFKVAVLYDENGVTSQQEFTLLGTESAHRFLNTVYNPIGASSFGSVKLGSQIENNEYDTYRFFIEINPNVFFYNISMQFSVDGEAQDFELVRFGYELAEVSKVIDRKYLI